MKTIRVFDSQHDDTDSNPFPAYAEDGDWSPMCEFNCVGNDAYHEWTVGNGALGDGEINGGGYISELVALETNKWLIAAGAFPGEEVLIKFWW